jgi:TolB protein
MRILLACLFSLTLLFGADATIEVSKKVEALPSIAVEDASIDYTNGFSKQFFRALVSDLNVLSLFNVDRHYTTAEYGDSSVNYSNKASEYVLRYRLSRDDSGAFVADARLLSGERVIMDKRYRMNNTDKYIFLVHTIAYDVNDKMGAPAVDWMKRKVILTRLLTPGRSEIMIADYTLTYQHVVVRGGLNVFPKWADDKQRSFYYTDLDAKQPTLYRMDTRTGKRTKLLSSDGMLVCSDVSKSGTQLLLTMAPNGQPDIYLYNTVTKRLSRQTSYSGIDVNGQFMEGNRIAFVSSRMGYPNIYSKHIDGSGVRQMVHYGKSNSTCSAHNEYIVYKARESNHAFGPNTFNLHLISTKTDFIRRLTATGINEFPRFSKDGDAILFIKNYQNQSAVGVIRIVHNKNYLFPLKIGKIQSIDW